MPIEKRSKTLMYTGACHQFLNQLVFLKEIKPTLQKGTLRIVMLRLFFGFLITPQGKFYLEKQVDWRLLQVSEERFIEAKKNKKIFLGRFFSQEVPLEDVEKEKKRIEDILSGFSDFPQKKLEFVLFYETFIG